MDTPSAPTQDKNHRFPVESISHAAGLYCRFSLSFRDVEALFCGRGGVVTSEALRKWCRKVGRQYANQLRRRRPRPADKGHLEERCLRGKGEPPYLWRAAEQAGSVLDLLVQRRREKRAAKEFLRNRLNGVADVPRVLVPANLKRYAAAKREILPRVAHRRPRYLNNRVQNSPHPARQRERPRQRFKSPGPAPRLLSAYGPIAQHFRPRRPRFSAAVYHQARQKRLQSWREITILD